MMTVSYWSAAEHAALESVANFDQMIPVGVAILQRMKELKQPIVQICGPMSTGGRGSLEANMAFFRKAQRIAEIHGLTVFDQGPFQDAILRLEGKRKERAAYCMEILHVFYRGIFESRLLNELVFLPGWETSVGARWEREEGMRLG